MQNCILLGEFISIFIILNKDIALIVRTCFAELLSEALGGSFMVCA
jgi:hypothetical protein